MVSVNSLAVRNPEIIREGARAFGNQCVVLGMDAKLVEVYDPNVLWQCTTCGACENQCPVGIEHLQVAFNAALVAESREPGSLVQSVDQLVLLIVHVALHLGQDRSFQVVLGLGAGGGQAADAPRGMQGDGDVEGEQHIANG